MSINPPIDPLDYLRGVKVVDIGDLRVARGKTRREKATCKHSSVVYDQGERRVWCEDCEEEIDPFDAFERLVSQHSAAWDQINKRAKEVADAEAFTLRSRAAKLLDEVWRGRKMAPCCPHCSEAILPEDVVGGKWRARMSREWVRAQRKKTTRT